MSEIATKSKSATNIGHNRYADSVQFTSSSGTPTTIPLVDDILAGFMSPSSLAKVDDWFATKDSLLRNGDNDSTLILPANNSLVKVEVIDWDNLGTTEKLARFNVAMGDETSSLGQAAIIANPLFYVSLQKGTNYVRLLDNSIEVSNPEYWRVAFNAASESYVNSAIAALVASSPAALDTLNELATALGNDANFATTTATSLGLKAPLASPTLTGIPAAPTAAVDTSTTQIATTGFVVGQGYLKSATAATSYLALTGGRIATSSSILHTETIHTPSGANPVQTIPLTNGNAQTLLCTSATGTIAVSLTRPIGSYMGRILVRVHATTATGITWAMSAGNLYWLGTQPTWTGLAVGKRIVVTVTCDGTDTYLAATEVNS